MIDFSLRAVFRRARELGPIFPLAMALMVAAALFGGASQQHSLRLAIVELFGLALLAASLIRHVQSHGPAPAREHGFVTALAVVTAAAPLAQLIPLPPAAWTGLPGRDQLTLALQVVGLQPGWAPLSLAPDQTWKAALALIPPLGMLCAVISLGTERAGRLLWILAAFAGLNIVWGLAQAALGSPSLYLWPTTDAGAVTGLFANRNHLATLCLMILPFAAVRAGRSLRRGQTRRDLYLFGSLATMCALMLLLIGSRAGVLLLLPIGLLSLTAAWTAAGRPRPGGRGLLVALGMIVVLAGLGAAVARPTLARFGAADVDIGRRGGWPVVSEAADTFLPVGSGVGSFDAVYRSVEPIERLTPLFFNHAHNDYLETWLETGWLGAALLIAFMVWFGRRSWAAWRGEVALARDLQRAASLAVLVCLLHSVVDYPLRTEMIAILFAFACGLLELSAKPSPRRSRLRKT